jgi:hypothetical protein
MSHPMAAKRSIAKEPNAARAAELTGAKAFLGTR